MRITDIEERYDKMIVMYKIKVLSQYVNCEKRSCLPLKNWRQNQFKTRRELFSHRICKT